MSFFQKPRCWGTPRNLFNNQGREPCFLQAHGGTLFAVRRAGSSTTRGFDDFKSLDFDIFDWELPGPGKM